jgi:hypothetical protein
MNVGYYVRTKDYSNISSKIGKIIKVDGNYYYLDIDKNTNMVWEKDTISKSSPQIIDLIEVGDYVNGRKVSKINLDRTLNKEKCILCADTNYDCLDTVYKNEDIKSIVTHEQMEAMQYRVEE